MVNGPFYENPSAITRVGWCSGRMVIACGADRVSERPRQLVYVDALAHENGQSLYYADGYSEADRAEERAQEEASGMPGFLPPPTDWVSAHIPPEADPE